MFKINLTFIVLAVSLVLLAIFPSAHAASRYTISANKQEVKDNKTQLVWKRCPEGMNWRGNTCVGSANTMTYQEALQQAVAQSTNTEVAWRLPDVKELSSLVDKKHSNPAIDTVTFPMTPNKVFWTSSPYIGVTNCTWGVDFSGGYVGFGYCRNNSLLVRLVHASQ